MVFSTSNEMKTFFFQSGYMVGYIYKFIFLEPFTSLWVEAYLINFDGLFDVFLDKVCKYFTQ